MPCALDEILIGPGVSGHRFPDWRDRVEGQEVINLLQFRRDHVRHFQNHKPPARFQDAVGITQCILHAGDIADAKGDGIGIKVTVREGQRLGIAADKFGSLGVGLFLSTGATDIEHMIINVADRNLSVGTRAV